MRRRSTSSASLCGVVLVIGLSLGSGVATEREVADFGGQPGQRQVLPEPEIEEGMPLRPAGVTTTFFKRFAGAFFQPRSAATGSYTYFGFGCITATVDSYYVHEVQVPDGAVIDFIRFYYYDAHADDATMTVTTYDGQGGSSDIVSVDSSGSGGYGSRGTNLNLPVDSIAQSIMILYRPNTVSSSLALCGARIRYQYNPLGIIFTDSFENVS